MMRAMKILPLLVAAFALAACATVPANDPAAARAALAPSGKLRVGLYPGSPTSYIAPTSGGEPRGVGYDVGQEIARRLGVPFEPVVLPNNAQVQEAAREGRVDLVLTNATEDRRRVLDFTDPVVRIAKSYLVPPGSTIADAAAVDREGVRVGVSQASTTQTELAQVLKHARLVPIASLADGRRMVAKGEIDAYASNNAILLEMGDRIPGSRLLPGQWGLETFAFGVPKGRDAGLAWLRATSEAVQAEGHVAKAAAKAGLRGTLP